MLTWNDVLLYVKGRLSLPSTFMEESDSELRQWIELTVLKEFSDYIPDCEFTAINPTLESYQEGRTNYYLFNDDEDLEILGVKNYYFSGGGSFMTGHPYIPPMSYTGMKEFALACFKSNILKPFSAWGYTGRYFQPNIVRVLPTIQDVFVIEYEREQPPDLRRIPGQYRRIFMDLALSEMQIKLGGLRTHYSQITTPFGEIPLNGEQLKSEGNELKERTIERLRGISLPGVFIDIG